MAFYISRINSNGEEVERRYSSYSFCNTISPPALPLTLTTALHSHKHSNVRYVNSAAYIEKTFERSSNSSINADEALMANNEGSTNMVPSLDISSNSYDSLRSKCAYESKQRQACLTMTLDRNPEVAYIQWLESKKKIIADKAAQHRKLAEQKRKEKDLRKSISEMKFQEWLNEKKRQDSLKKITHVKTQLEEIDNEGNLLLKSFESKLKVLEWECNKQRQKRAKLLLQQQREAQKCEELKLRKQKADEAWQKWISVVDTKPKPVPFNKGLYSLKGAITQIYVNPKEWQT